MKRPMQLPSLPDPFPYPFIKFLTQISDLAFQPTVYIQFSLQSQWDVDVFNKLHSVKPILGKWYPSYRSISQEEVIITRLRIGHSRLKHSWLLASEDALECIQCNELMTIEHILLDSTDFQQIHEGYYNADTVCTTSLTQSALILCDLLPLSKRLFYTIKCDTFLIPHFNLLYNPFSYHLIHFILRGFALLGASYLIGDGTSSMGEF